MYKFRLATKEEEKELWTSGYAGKHIYGAGASENNYALFLGRMITLFGKPDNLSEDWENMYNYDVIAEDEQGNRFLVEIYHGAGGPSVALPIERDNIDITPYEQASKELVELIMNTEPSDYEWESVYEDIPVNIKYIVKDGKAKVESEFPEDFDM